jgi:hypothetical protein
LIGKCMRCLERGIINLPHLRRTGDRVCTGCIEPTAAETTRELAAAHCPHDRSRVRDGRFYCLACGVELPVELEL